MATCFSLLLLLLLLLGFLRCCRAMPLGKLRNERRVGRGVIWAGSERKGGREGGRTRRTMHDFLQGCPAAGKTITLPQVIW